MALSTKSPLVVLVWGPFLHWVPASPGSGRAKQRPNQVIMFMTCQTHPCALETTGQLAPGVGVHGGVPGCKIYGVPSGKEHTLLPGHRCLRSALQKGLCVFCGPGTGVFQQPHLGTGAMVPVGQEGACKEGPSAVWWGLHPGGSVSASRDPCLPSGRERQAMAEPVSQLPALAVELQRSAGTETGSRDPGSHTVCELWRGSLLAGLLPELIGKGHSSHALSLTGSHFD